MRLQKPLIRPCSSGNQRNSEKAFRNGIEQGPALTEKETMGRTLLDTLENSISRLTTTDSMFRDQVYNLQMLSLEFAGDKRICKRT